MTFGERVKAKREELGMTQAELAARLGYKSRASINKIEQSKRNMKQSQIATLAKALDTTPGYLMGWKETPPQQTHRHFTVPVYDHVAAGIPIDAIEDMIEKKLMGAEAYEVAKKYITYRYEKERVRNNKSLTEKLTASNVVNQNANIDEFSFGGRIGESA